jgi:hypothetical protein
VFDSSDPSEYSGSAGAMTNTANRERQIQFALRLEFWDKIGKPGLALLSAGMLLIPPHGFAQQIVSGHRTPLQF